MINGWARLDPQTARCFDTRLALLSGSGPRAYLRAQPLFLYPPAWNSAHADELDAELEAQIAHFPGAEMVQRRIAQRGCSTSPTGSPRSPRRHCA